MDARESILDLRDRMGQSIIGLEALPAGAATYRPGDRNIAWI